MLLPEQRPAALAPYEERSREQVVSTGPDALDDLPELGDAARRAHLTEGENIARGHCDDWRSRVVGPELLVPEFIEQQEACFEISVEIQRVDGPRAAEIDPTLCKCG